MGQTRLAFVVKREDRGVVAESLVALGVRAFIAQQSGHPVVVFPDRFETNEFQQLRELGVGLSKDLNCRVLAVGRVSSDPLWIGLFESGRLVLDTIPPSGSCHGENTPSHSEMLSHGAEGG